MSYTLECLTHFRNYENKRIVLENANPLILIFFNKSPIPDASHHDSRVCDIYVTAVGKGLKHENPLNQSY